VDLENFPLLKIYFPARPEFLEVKADLECPLLQLKIILRGGSCGSCLESAMHLAPSGPGIEDHFKAHLMEPFFTTKEFGLGMGVGLSLSRAIAQDHGGPLTLRKESNSTCFRLALLSNQVAQNGK
jgi:nitrogen-specific signal transduction histidine kinase